MGNCGNLSKVTCGSSDITLAHVCQRAEAGVARWAPRSPASQPASQAHSRLCVAATALPSFTCFFSKDWLFHNFIFKTHFSLQLKITAIFIIFHYKSIQLELFKLCYALISFVVTKSLLKKYLLLKSQNISLNIFLFFPKNIQLCFQSIILLFCF